MDFDKIAEVVNSSLNKEIKRTLIISIIAEDENAIPDMLNMLHTERNDNRNILMDMNLELSRAHIYIDMRPEGKKESKDSFNKGFILDEISKFYIKYKDRVTHCFNRFK